MVAKAVGFEGEIVFDAAKPDGTPQKLLDVSRLAAMAWAPGVSLQDGIGLAYRDCLKNWGNRCAV